MEWSGVNAGHRGVEEREGSRVCGELFMNWCVTVPTLTILCHPHQLVPAAHLSLVDPVDPGSPGFL